MLRLRAKQSKSSHQQQCLILLFGDKAQEQPRDSILRYKMSTTISILGGVGVFLLGMTVMTDGLKARRGSALRQIVQNKQQHQCVALSGALLPLFSCSPRAQPPR